MLIIINLNFFNFDEKNKTNIYAIFKHKYPIIKVVRFVNYVKFKLNTVIVAIFI